MKYQHEGTLTQQANPFEPVLANCGKACDDMEDLARHKVIDLCRTYAGKCEAALSAYDVVNFERGRVEEFRRLFTKVQDNGAYDLNLRALLKFNRNR